MRRRNSSIGQLISTLVYFVMSIWLASAARGFYLEGENIKAILVGVGSILAFVATRVFQPEAKRTRTCIANTALWPGLTGQ